MMKKKGIKTIMKNTGWYLTILIVPIIISVNATGCGIPGLSVLNDLSKLSGQQLDDTLGQVMQGIDVPELPDVSKASDTLSDAGQVIENVDDALGQAMDKAGDFLSGAADKVNEALSGLSFSLPDGQDFEIPEYAGQPYDYVNGNVPFFTEDEITAEPFESYEGLDALGRTGSVTACLKVDDLNIGPRADISGIKPSGWAQEKYSFVDEEWLYNRCHLRAHSLGGRDDETNLITGTRYFNTEGMWPIEESAVYYLEGNPGKHLMYRVTPVYEGTNLLASGVLMEAYSVEDGGKLSYCVFVHNVQPNVTIDYATGENFPATP